VSDLTTRRRNSVFGHIARLSEDTPAHQALRCHVDLTLGHLPGQIKAGSVAQAVPTTDGLTSYTQGQQQATRHQLICGEDPPHVVIGSDATVLDNYALTTTTISAWTSLSENKSLAGSVTADRTAYDVWYSY